MQPPSAVTLIEQFGSEKGFKDLLNDSRDLESTGSGALPETGAEPELTPCLETVAALSADMVEAVNLGNFVEAGSHAVRAIRQQEACPIQHPGRLSALYADLGVILYRLRMGRQRHAANLYSLGYDLEQFGPKGEEVFLALFRVAESAAGLGKFETAEQAYLCAWDLVLDLDGPDSQRTANVCSGLAEAMSRLGRVADCLTVSKKALDTYVEANGELSWDVATCRSNHATRLLSAGRVPQARNELLRALEIYRELDAIATNGAILCLSTLGEISPGAEGLSYLEEACSLAEEHLSPSDWILSSALRAYGWALLGAERISEAEGFLVTALDLDREFRGPRSAETAKDLARLAGLWRARGHSGKALSYFQEAYDIQSALLPLRHPDRLAWQTNLGIMYQRVGKFAEATSAWQGALALSRELAPDGHPRSARLLQNLGASSLKIHDLEGAVEYLSEGLSMTEELFGRHTETARAARWLARSKLRTGDLDEAFELAQESLDLQTSLGNGDHREVAAAQETLGSVLLQHGQAEQALELATGAVARLDKLRTNISGPGTDRALYSKAISFGDVASLKAMCELTLGRPEDAFATFERTRGRLLLELLNSGHEPSMGWSPTEVLGSAEIRSALGSSEGLRAYFWSHRWVFLFTLSADGVRGSIIAGGEENVEALARQVDQFVELLATPGQSAGQAALGAELARTLWPTPAEALQRWAIVPDGPLSSLPLESLPLDSDSTNFAYASSGTLYRDRCELSKRKGNGLSLLALGDPKFGVDRALSALPGSRAEVEQVCKAVLAAGGDVRMLLGAEATLRALESSTDSRTILHLATHGYPGSLGRPLDAALALASSEGESDSLTLRRLIDAWHDRLSDCELVVLSACETQRSTRVGDSLTALSWGFFSAGVPTVIASLWKVDDRATTLLMDRFYHNLLQENGPTKLAALSAAKRWLAAASRREIRAAEERLGLNPDSAERSRSPHGSAAPHSGELRPYSDPAYWAGFVLLGSP